MAVKSKEELMTAIRAKIGEDSDDETLTLVEDISDTLDSFAGGENWKTKYEENDKAWRQKYRDRFFSATETEEDAEIDGEDDPKNLTFDELFKED